MKWNNKGHQYDEEAQQIIKTFGNKKICIYGAGLYGSEMYRVIKKYRRFSVFLDADVNKQEKGYEGEKVREPLNYLDNCKDIIVICASVENSEFIKDILVSKGKEHRKDFFYMQEFDEYYWPIIAAYYYENCYMPLSQIVLTNRCTLKCKKCAHGCQTPTSKEDMPIDEVKYSLDSFFKNIYFIRKFDLIGGEPLLYRKLHEVVTYIGEKYLQKVGCIEITTNGTILPSEELLKACHKFGIFFNISDYSHEVKAAMDKRKLLVEQLEKYSVNYHITTKQIWVDYGFDRGYCSDSPESDLIELFDKCRTPCREIRGHRLYYCVAGRVSSQAYEFDNDVEEALDLSVSEGDFCKIFLEFNLGYCKKGYLEACRRCKGGFRINKDVVPVAVQVR